jgi:hypothetical protein
MRCSAPRMTGLGQNEKASRRAHLVRNSSDSGHNQDVPAGSLRAKTGCEQPQQRGPLFDHLVGEREQLVWHGEAKHPGRLSVDDQFELARLHDR